MLAVRPVRTFETGGTISTDSAKWIIPD